MKPPEPLDDPKLVALWAKSMNDDGQWLSLYQHLEDTAGVADALYGSWFSSGQRSILSSAVGSASLAHKLAVWFGAAHDVGKASFHFARKSCDLVHLMASHGWDFSGRYVPGEEIPHGTVSQIAAGVYIHDRWQWGRKQWLGTVLGGHHGVFPPTDSLRPQLLALEHPDWADARHGLLDRAFHIAEICDEDMMSLKTLRVPRTVEVLYTGFLIVCDWIASNEYLFPYHVGSERSMGRVAVALRKLSLPSPWQPARLTKSSQIYRERFAIVEPRPMQEVAYEAAKSIANPALMIIEAPTGEGKTEAAFAVAEVLANTFGERGVFVGLPTRATTDAMFPRMLQWLQAMGHPTPVNVHLSHSLADFNEQFRSIAGQSFETWDEAGTDEANAIVHGWFTGRKKSIMSDFVVGTIDQLLFLALKSKHLALRHLGLSSKVVVLDEVHDSDEYMGVYLNRALMWLGAYGVPVIALSATLSPERRAEMLTAYAVGASRRLESGKARLQAGVQDSIRTVARCESYPVILVGNCDHVRAWPARRSGRDLRFGIEVLGDDVDDLLAFLEAELADGGCVAVVRNTVNRAQELFEALSQRFGQEAVLLHSRFTAESRRRREQKLREEMGPTGRRPHRRIICATQVIEQSLDLDFDILVSDFAPSDSLIQRMGRVHRHARPETERPAHMRSPRLVVTGLDWNSSSLEPPQFDPGSKAVYGESALLRTAAAWAPWLGPTEKMMHIPDDVPELIRNTFDSGAPSPSGWEVTWQKAELKAEQNRLAKVQKADVGCIPAPNEGDLDEWTKFTRADAREDPQPGMQAQVRDIEASIDVILIQNIGGRLYSLPWLADGLGGQSVDMAAGIPDDLARAVAECSVSLPVWTTRGPQFELLLDELEGQGMIPTWQESPWLRGLLPLALNEQFEVEIAGFHINYSTEIGLTIVRKEQPHE